MSQLPEPVSVTDQYLRLLLEKQEEILAELKKTNARAALPAGLVELKEPINRAKVDTVADAVTDRFKRRIAAPELKKHLR